MPEQEPFFQTHWIICISIVCTTGYIILGVIYNKVSRDSFVNILSVFFSSAAVMSGFHLSVSTLISHKIVEANIENSEVAATIIGGFTVSWLGFWEIVKRIRDVIKKGSE